MNRAFQRKGIFIHNVPAIFSGDAVLIARWLDNHGFTAVYPKCSDRGNTFISSVNNKINVNKTFVDTMHLHNIAVIGWGFNYGDNPTAEGLIAANQCDSLGLDGWVFDIESAFEGHADAVSRASILLASFKTTIKTPVETGVCSWAYYWGSSTNSQIHNPKITEEMLKYCNYLLPMIYWNSIQDTKPVPMTDDQVLRYCNGSFAQQKIILSRLMLSAEKRIIPILRSYTGDAGFANAANVTAAGAWAKTLATGASWWFMDHAVALPDVADALKSTPGWQDSGEFNMITLNSVKVGPSLVTGVVTVELDVDGNPITLQKDQSAPIVPPPPPTSAEFVPAPYYLLSDQDMGLPWRLPDAPLDAYPATIVVEGGNGIVHIAPEILVQLKRIQTLEQYNREWSDEHGWHNKPHIPDPEHIGTVRQVTFAHSMVWITAKSGNQMFVDHYNNQEVKNLDFVLNRDKYRANTFSIMHKTLHKDNGGIFYDNLGFIKTLLIANNDTEKLWIDAKYLRPMVKFPFMTNTVAIVNVRSSPSSADNNNIVGRLVQGAEAMIVEMKKVNNGVWGRMQDTQNWIALWYTTSGF